jgi:hypothetical protein
MPQVKKATSAKVAGKNSKNPSRKAKNLNRKVTKKPPTKVVAKKTLELDYSKVKLADLPKNADGTPKKKHFVLWLINKLNRAIPKNKRKKNSL